MFTWLNKQGVQSDKGFVLQFTGRFSAEYLEENRTVNLYVEDGITDGCDSIILDPSAFDQWDDGTPIPPEDRPRLFQNVRDALEFQGLKMVVQKGESPFE